MIYRLTTVTLLTFLLNNLAPSLVPLMEMTTSAIQKVFKKLAKKAGLTSRYSIHALRHTRGTELYKASGYNLRLVQQQLGHSSPTITSVYAAVLNKDLEKAVENMEFEG